MNIKERIKSVFVSPESESNPIIIEPKVIKPLIKAVPIPMEISSVHQIEDRNATSVNDLSYGVQATSITTFRGETFNPYAFSTFRNLYTYSEPSFYKDYDNSTKTNPFSSMVLEYLMREVFSAGFHFEGPGAKPTEDFFVLDNTRNKIEIAFREALKKGNGFMDVTVKGKKLVRTRVLDPQYINIEFDLKTGDRKYTQQGTGLGQGPMVILKPDLLIHMMLREEVGVPYGISLFRSNIVFLTALMDVGGDIMAALKRVAYAPIIANLDLDSYADDAEKEKAMDAFATKLKNVQSSTNNFTIDKKHKLELLGQGGAGARLLPTNDMIEPILSVVLLNFGVPLGMFLQTGANKSIIDEQRAAMQRFYEELRNKIKYYVETRMIPYVTGRNTILVWNKPSITNLDVQNAFKIHITAFEKGLLSAEYIKEHWDIDDKGSTFANPNKPANANPDKPPTTGN